MATSAVAVPATAMAFDSRKFAVFDSTLAPSRAFARTLRAPALDLAAEHRTRFAALRSGLGAAKSVEGLTRWADWVAVRGELERQGWRASSEARHRGLIRWTMRRR